MANLYKEPELVKLKDVPVGSQIRFKGVAMVYTILKTTKDTKVDEEGNVQNLQYEEGRLAWSKPNSDTLVEVISTAKKKGGRR